jgi:F-type H+-transporting ATPase subunit b
VIEVSEKILRRELSNKSEQEKYINELAEGVKLN